jgi:hypothetical protein
MQTMDQNVGGYDLPTNIKALLVEWGLPTAFLLAVGSLGLPAYFYLIGGAWLGVSYLSNAPRRRRLTARIGRLLRSGKLAHASF